MQNKFNLSLGTNIFDDYQLFDALRYTVENEFGFVEIASIDNVCEHVDV